MSEETTPNEVSPQQDTNTQAPAETAAAPVAAAPEVPPTTDTETIYQGIRVLNCDGAPDSSGDLFLPQTQVQLPNHAVNVHSTFSDLSPATVIGVAQLSLDGKGVLATLWMKTSADGLYPAIGGVCLDRNADVINTCRVDYLVVSPSKNQDRRITPLSSVTPPAPSPVSGS